MYSENEVNLALKEEYILIKKFINEDLCLNGNNGGRCVDSNKGRKLKDPMTGLTFYDLSSLKMVETRKKNNSFKTGAAKASQTKRSIISEEGKNLFETSSEKAMSTLGKSGLSLKNLKTASTLRNQIFINGKNGLQLRAQQSLVSRNCKVFEFYNENDEKIFGPCYIGDIIKQINDIIISNNGSKINIKVVTNSSKENRMFNSDYYNQKRLNSLKEKGQHLFIKCYLKLINP